MHVTVNDKIAIVTGATRGIGLATARMLLESGAAGVTITSRRIENVETALEELAEAGFGPDRVFGLAARADDDSEAEKAVAGTVGRFGRIDILVNNAGVAGLNAKVADYPIEEWDRVMTINLRSQFLCCRQVIPGMIERNYGRICNIASIAGKEGNPTASAYSASKAGVIALTKSLAKEVAEYNISVNAITPAAAKTKIFDQVSEEHIAYMLAKIPRGRFLKVEEAAATIAFIVSEECSFTTGFAFDISGG
ncbi:MAG TPA: SDR family NAD(P)-dependent oxidoreductase, partial [Acidimicrobiales bacterium]|nr:SDR family NAD(P)-dependent oxidoreductase [Acidimicrobiales bacterium]